MRSISRLRSASTGQTFFLLSLLTAATFACAAPAEDPMGISQLRRRQNTNIGCYSSSTPLTSIGKYMYQSSGYCTTHCRNQNSPVAATTGGNECFCGDEIPAASDKTSDSHCNIKCTGYGSANCGGDGFWTVYLTGLDDDVGNYGSSSSSSTHSPSSTSSSATIVTSEVAGGHTIIVTQTAAIGEPAAQVESSKASGNGGGTNTAGIAAGVVVGILVLAGLGVGAYFFMRRRKRQQAEEHFKQQTQVSDFMRGTNESQAPNTGYSNTSDARLEPEAGHRNSVGSLADNQDYSRRILRVANPDSS